MSKYLDFVNELLDESPEAKKEVELLSLKYEIIRLLIEYRKRNEISQTDFANKIGVKQQMVSRFEKGDVDPRLSFISKIIGGMNYDVKFSEKDYFMTKNILQFNMKKKISIPSNYNLITNYEVAI
ncbi:MAG: helix-turn-helix transcriptional regulator [Peptostreptococcaceae bacterium]|nr:helix-turn-helix transcriptional regulator [Peptostreptococcaceae bacterium]